MQASYLCIFKLSKHRSIIDLHCPAAKATAGGYIEVVRGTVFRSSLSKFYHALAVL